MSKLPASVQTTLVFAARYVRDRDRQAVLTTHDALRKCWWLMHEDTRAQILDEARMVVSNAEDWHEFRRWAEIENVKIKP